MFKKNKFYLKRHLYFLKACICVIYTTVSFYQHYEPLKLEWCYFFKSPHLLLTLNKIYLKCKTYTARTRNTHLYKAEYFLEQHTALLIMLRIRRKLSRMKSLSYICLLYMWTFSNFLYRYIYEDILIFVKKIQIRNS